MIAKFATPFYPERFVRGNLNFLRNRLNRTFYEFIIIKRLGISAAGQNQKYFYGNLLMPWAWKNGMPASGSASSP
jgi:hypothetical protein